MDKEDDDLKNIQKLLGVGNLNQACKIISKLGLTGRTAK